MALATVEDVSARLGRTVLPDETARVQAFIDDVSALVEAYCFTDFVRHTGETVTLFGVADRFLALPSWFFPNPVVTSVTVDDVEVPADEYIVLNHALYRACGWDCLIVTVTGDWGYETPPTALKGIVCSEVIRWMATSPGVVIEKTGDLEIQFGASASSQSLSPAAVSALRRYRPSMSTIALRRD